ncbi:hypothetical protein [Nitrobacter sp. JJSN]|uniref:hypothetical protein n=1 Tax=Nitrobacter sp. JJSN TaxID=3453033 RepID=UPI003F75C560
MLQVLGLFCEDIRDEKSGQVSIVGILPDSIQLPPPPDNKEHLTAILPKLGLYIRVMLPLEGPSGPMPVGLAMPDGTTISLGDIGTDVIAKAKSEAIANHLPLAGLIFHATMQGFQIATTGLMSAVLDCEGERNVCAMMNVKPATSTASASTPQVVLAQPVAVGSSSKP